MTSIEKKAEEWKTLATKKNAAFSAPLITTRSLKNRIKDGIP